MLLNEVQKILNAKVLTGSEYLMESIDYGYGCDLMSDVLAFVNHNILLLTGLAHPQVIRTAEMLDIKAIVLVRGKQPEQNMVEMAESKGIVLLSTKHSLFTASGKLYAEGLEGEEIAHDDFSL